MVLLVTSAQTLLVDALVYLMVAVTVVSGGQYAIGFLRGRRAGAPRVAPPGAVKAARPSLG